MQSIETSTQLFSQAATLMAVGMGFVFAFLGLLIVVIKLFIAPLAKKYPDKIPQVAVKNVTSTGQKDQSKIIAAISVAINQYRNKHQ